MEKDTSSDNDDLQSWKDAFLTWNPEEYGGLREVGFDEKKLWKPDVTVHQRSGPTDLHWFPVRLIANYTGDVVWVSMASLQLVCGQLDYSGYPWDTKRCVITLGSWTCSKNDIDLHMKGWNLTIQEKTPKNANWRIANTSFKRVEVVYELIAPVPFAELVYVLELERQGSPTAFVNGVPCAAARLLVLFVFLAEGPIVKFLFACTSLVTHLIMASIVLHHIPAPALTVVALSRVTSGLALCLSAVGVQLVVCALASCRLQMPAFVRRLNGTACCRLVTFRATFARLDEPDLPQGQTARDDCLFLATLLNRCACAVFCILLVFV